MDWSEGIEEDVNNTNSSQLSWPSMLVSIFNTIKQSRQNKKTCAQQVQKNELIKNELSASEIVFVQNQEVQDLKNKQNMTSVESQILISNPQVKDLQKKTKIEEEQNIYCQICFGYAKNAFVCSNQRCNKLFCESCPQNLRNKVNSKCPFCRMEPLSCLPSPNRESINLKTIICQLCEEKFILAEEEFHYKFKCSYLDRKICHFCQKYISKEKIVKHTKEMHSDKIHQIITLLYENSPPIIEAKKVINESKIYLSKVNKLPRLGQNGKFYCEGKLQTRCTCCNGYCGPNNGQNCLLCMKLDIKRLGLPRGYLVNSFGQICYKKGDDFVCGANGCEEGDTCRPCRNMKTNIKRYQELIQ